MLAAGLAALVLSTGLHGVVTKGPTTPVCQADVSCERPAGHVTLTFVRGTYSQSAVTDTDGRYRISLPAGLYSVRIARARAGFSPHAVRVIAGRVRVYNFAIDTGIR